jgi:hypothetical protein
MLDQQHSEGHDRHRSFLNFFWYNSFSAAVVLEFPGILQYKVTAIEYQKYFQEPCSTAMEAIVAFHDDLMFFLIFITGFVT